MKAATWTPTTAASSNMGHSRGEARSFAEMKNIKQGSCQVNKNSELEARESSRQLITLAKEAFDQVAFVSH